MVSSEDVHRAIERAFHAAKAVVIRADGVGRRQNVRLVHRAFPGLAAARDAKIFHEPQRFFSSRERGGVTGDARVAKQRCRAVRAGAQHRIACLAQS